MSVKAAFNNNINNFPNANLVLEIFLLNVSQVVNKEVGVVITKAYFSKQILTLLLAIIYK